MKYKTIDILGRPVTIIVDSERRPFYHDCGAELKFKNEPISVYSISYDDVSEIAILVGDNDPSTYDILKSAWQCFFKILSLDPNGDEDYKHFGKEIYAQTFIDTYDKISDTILDLQTQQYAEEQKCIEDYLKEDAMEKMEENCFIEHEKDTTNTCGDSEVN